MGNPLDVMLIAEMVFVAVMAVLAILFFDGWPLFFVALATAAVAMFVFGRRLLVLRIDPD